MVKGTWGHLLIKMKHPGMKKVNVKVFAALIRMIQVTVGKRADLMWFPYFFLCPVYEMLKTNAPTSSRNPVVNLYIT